MASQAVVTNTFTPSERLGRSNFNEFLKAALRHKEEAIWKGDKRFYITFLPSINNTAVNFGNSDNRREVINYNIRTKLTGSFNNIDGSQKTNNLAELSTAEIVSHVGGTAHQVILDSKFPLNQQYIARQYGPDATIDLHGHPSSPPLFTSGSYLISKINDDNPSLLVELNRDQQLPNGLGDKEFIVIPENLHPFVKDNLEYFLTRAGINVSGDASQFIKLNEKNRNLP